MTQTLMACLPRLFGTRSRVPRKNPIATDMIMFWIIERDFLFILIMVCSVYSLE